MFQNRHLWNCGRSLPRVMDIGLVIGLVFGMAALLGGFLLEGGGIGALFQVTALTPMSSL